MVLLKPGPVEIFCNIHSKMRADVLVVPNSHWTRVAADGSFSLSGVPVGTRKIVLWSPTLKPVSQQVDVTAEGRQRDVRVGGDVGPAAPEQARPGLRFVR